MDQSNKNQPQPKNSGENGKKAMADYEAEAAAVRAKTERLRALRLARDAAQSTAASTAAPKRVAAGKKQPAKTGKRTSATLSQWLEDQQKGGRRT